MSQPLAGVASRRAVQPAFRLLYSVQAEIRWTTIRPLVGPHGAKVLRRCYTRRWSLWLDLAVLIKTIPAVMRFDQTS